MSQLYIDDEAKSLIKKTQDVVYNNNKVTLDLKDLVYLAFKRPEIVARLINMNFASEMDEKFKKKIQELRNVVKDDGFLNDLREISEDFKYTDMEEWPEDVDLFSKLYAGKYIATIGKTVVAFGDNAKLVRDEARRKFPNEEPILAKIPKEDLLIL